MASTFFQLCHPLPGAALSIVAVCLILDVSDMGESKALHHEVQKY